MKQMRVCHVIEKAVEMLFLKNVTGLFSPKNNQILSSSPCKNHANSVICGTPLKKASHFYFCHYVVL